MWASIVDFQKHIILLLFPPCREARATQYFTLFAPLTTNALSIGIAYFLPIGGARDSFRRKHFYSLLIFQTNRYN